MYKGYVNVTKEGFPCQRWDVQYPHGHPFHDPITTDNFPDDFLSDANNYCRNPDLGSGGPWCYTTDPSIRWQYCAIEPCSK